MGRRKTRFLNVFDFILSKNGLWRKVASELHFLQKTFFKTGDFLSEIAHPPLNKKVKLAQ